MSTAVAVHVPAWKKVGLKLKAAEAPAAAVRGDEQAETKHVEAEAEVSEKGERRKRRKERKEAKEKEGDDLLPAAAAAAKEEKKTKKEKKKDKAKKPQEASSSTSSPSSPSAPTPTPTATPVPTTTTAPAAQNSTKSLLRAPRSQHTPRKSVTFSSDTKATDGDSIKTLYQNHDPFAHYDSYQQHLANYPTNANELPAGFDDDVGPRRKKVVEQVEEVQKEVVEVVEVRHKFGSTGKRKKFTDDDEEAGAGGAAAAADAGMAKDKAKDTAAPAAADPPRKKHKKAKAPAAAAATAKKPPGHEGNKAQLSYLATYHAHREAWKFEKSKQNWILRHAFDTGLIPDAHGAALRSYIAGLQGAAARDRLLEAANEVVKRGGDTISKDGEKLDVQDQREGVARAKLVLAALGHGDDSDEEENSDGGSSSSDSDSSDSDSGSGSGDEE